MGRLDAAVVGEIYIDHVFSELPGWPAPGEEVFTNQYVRELGGGAAVTACSLGRLGRGVSIFGVVGAEEKAWIKARFETFGVDASHLEHREEATGTTCSVSTIEDRSFFTFRGANRSLREYLLTGAVMDQLGQASHVHFAAGLDRDVALHLIPELRKTGCPISIDVGWQPDWYRDAENRRTLGEADFFFPNEKEAQLVTGEKQPEKLLAALAALGIHGVVVKLGDKGAIARYGDSIVRARSLAVSVVDTTGAGDAFNAGFIDALIERAPMREMLQRGSICGSLSTRVAGALMGLPNREELESNFEQVCQS